MVLFCFVFFFFKQKTAYEMLLCDWSSDVCSSDLSMPFVCGPRERAMLASRRGESDLICRSGEWYLLATCSVVEPAADEVDDYLGVDLGVKNIAATSDGETFA